MKKHTVEVTYYVPVFTHVTVEAEDGTDACLKAIDAISAAEQAGTPFPYRLDYEIPSIEFITGIWEGEEAYAGPQIEVPAEWCRDFRLLHE